MAAAQTAIEQGLLTHEHIAQFGFFKKFEDEYLDLYAPIVDSNELRSGTWPKVADAKAEAMKPETQWRLLAHGIPAQSYAAAVNPLESLFAQNNSGAERNFNMPGLRDAGSLGWPQERIVNGPFDFNWLHSDFRNVAMPYVYPVYEQMLDNGNLREQSQ